MSDSEAVDLPDADQMLRDIIEHRGWSIRDGQMKMVQSITETMDDPEQDGGAVINAPVGTGKSLAYSVAGVASGKRTVICTSTKALQNQLIETDLPELARDLEQLYGYKMSYAVLKGRSNYLCMSSAKYQLSRATGEEVGDPGEDDLFGDIGDSVLPDTVQTLKTLVDSTQKAMDDGDNSQLAQDDNMRKLPWDIRREVFADRKCKNRTETWSDMESEDDEYSVSEPRRSLEEVACTTMCAYRKAYAEAAKADIVVINTSLLAAEITRANVAEEPIQSPLQLPQAGLIVVDEAQHMDRILMDSFSQELDFESIYNHVDSYYQKIVKRRKAMEERLSSWSTVLDDGYDELIAIIDDENIKESELLSRVSDQLEEIGETIKEMFSAIKLRGQDKPSNGTMKVMNSLYEYLKEDVIDNILEVANILPLKAETGMGKMEDVYDVKFAGDDDEYLVISAVPISLTFVRHQLSKATALSSRPFQEVTEGMDFARIDDYSNFGTVIMCSGTITDEEGEYIGMDGGYFQVDSPFDHSRSRIYLPNALPQPYDEEWLDESWDQAKQAILATGGRTLFLTTSYYNLEEFHQRADGDPDFKKAGINIHYQDREGTVTRQDLVNRFKEDETSVLMGTSSFWEGVNVPGPSCSLVIMDKIMFPHRGNPVVAAKRRYVERNYGPERTFDKVDVNWAATMIAQGAGRLIRSETDIGGIMLLDNRLMEKQYGSSVLKLLPQDILKTFNFDAFLEWMEFVRENPDAESVPDHDKVLWRPIKPRRPQRRKRR